MLGRAFAEAYKQASATQKFAAQAVKDTPGAAATYAASGLSLQEACQILNVRPPQGGKANMDVVMERFKKLFDVNEPKNGGSFYLQSKVLRARERIEMEVRDAAEKGEMLADVKVFKDR